MAFLVFLPFLPFLLLLPPKVWAPPTRLRVLVTGYEAFMNYTTNPSQQVATMLNNTCARLHSVSDGEVCVTSIHLSVDRTGASLVASQLVQQAHNVPWDAVLHLGYESISKGLRLEIVAANVLATDSRPPRAPSWSVEVPCNKSGTAFEAVADAAPCLLATTAPLDRLNLPLPLHAADHPLERERHFDSNPNLSIEPIRMALLRPPC